MNECDKPIFLRKMREVAYAVDRKIKIDQIDSYFVHLKDYPIDIVCMAMDKALKERDPNNSYLTRSLVTVPEIQARAKELMIGFHSKSNFKCNKCTQDGWILLEQHKGQPIAKRCECLLAVIDANNK